MNEPKQRPAINRINLVMDCAHAGELAEEQFYKTTRTMLDPAGHPFCIDTEGEE